VRPKLELGNEGIVSSYYEFEVSQTAPSILAKSGRLCRPTIDLITVLRSGAWERGKNLGIGFSRVRNKPTPPSEEDGEGRILESRR